MTRTIRLALFALAALLVHTPSAHAFWLLNFQTGATLPPGGIGFIGGTGGQLTSVGDPSSSSFTPFLAHAGIRFGLVDGLDLGYRLCTVPLPYSSAGPSLGAEADLKLRLTPAESVWQAGLIGGVGYSYLLILGQSKSAWAPGADLLVSRRMVDHLDLSWNARYVYTGIPTAAGGTEANHVQAIGGSMGARIGLGSGISLLPEVGVFDFTGSIAGATVNGWGLQYGAVLAARLK